ncbi:methyltransferase small [Methylocella silvestris BL2]|uniref:Methyltransferase small n=1 Tax=Methylocella silvestris (strain DSM 15510 / CIP 108128 / LMG 27833 / NCIMB 13906 / BL2) TaxID=395965 RepID=B8ET32_METSB|nr:methyltransferase [Methylocella silvestris]ACK51170.1 methyltransferase small [Methylocella silvestris BL2]
MTVENREGVFGAPPAELAGAGAGAIQFSPLVPGAAALEDQAEASLAAMTMLAPPGALERRRALALALRALAPGAALVALAPKDKGGARLKTELEGFGCAVEESSKRHHRICRAERPAKPEGLEQAIEEGAPRFCPETGIWSEPGVFSWNRIDPGSQLLADSLPALKGEGADLGCGVGFLARRMLASPKVTTLHLIDIDRRAIAAARRNVEDPRATIIWADARESGLKNLDFIVTNPPFHDAGEEDRALGQAFIRQAASMLRKGGALWLVANRHLPYEGALKPLFREFAPKIEASGYKVFEAIK